jgi:hypothetical protein
MSEPDALDLFLAGEDREGPDFTASESDVKRFAKAPVIVVTGALNNAPLQEKAWATLRRYCELRSAELLVQPLRYRNPTSRIEAKMIEEETWWTPEVVPFLVEGRFQLHPSLWMMADIPIQATAVNPLTGLDTLTRSVSGIFGHPQLCMEVVPTPQTKYPKILHTTGVVTEKNYSHTKAGKKGEFHHSVSALVIEKQDKLFHLRQLVFDSEDGFFDVDRYYHPKGSRKSGRAGALVTGDTHVDRIDAGVAEATYGDDGIISVCKPEILAWHDVLDFQSGSHHNDPVERLALGADFRGQVRGEVHRALRFVDDHTPADTISIVVPSNHNEHLERWAMEQDWRRQGSKENAEFLLELQLAMVRGAKASHAGVEKIDPLRHWAEQFDIKATFLHRGESFRVADVELGFHGDVGPNGARGTRRNLDRIGARAIIGHSHSPGIYRGVWQVGTSSVLDLVYARKGPSSWLHTHCLVWPNGKRQLITIIDGKWRSTA